VAAYPVSVSVAIAPVALDALQRGVVDVMHLPVLKQLQNFCQLLRLTAVLFRSGLLRSYRSPNH